MIYTSSYLYGDGLEKTMSISGDRGKMFDYNGSYYSKLAPKKEFFDVWRNNIGKVSKIDPNRITPMKDNKTNRYGDTDFVSLFFFINCLYYTQTNIKVKKNTN